MEDSTLTSEHLLSESEPELLALLPERGGQQRVAAVEHRHLAPVLLPQLGEHLVPVWSARQHPA